MINENQTTISNLFDLLGYDYLEMEPNTSYDVSQQGYEIKSLAGNESTWSLIKKIVRKESTDAYHVPQYDLNVSPLHRFFVKINGSEPHWAEATALVDCENVEFFHEDRGWELADVVWKKGQKIDILDLEVEGTHSYFSNGVLSHNTMHGDPITTPGGKAIPFHASVRIRLGSGSPIKDKAGNVIGIHTTVTLKKNKVAPPFRKCEFDIHFGRGIVEHEFLFDECRSWCDKNKVVMDIAESKGQTRKVEVSISGSGTWKELTVSDVATGEVLLEKKFYKNDFGDLMRDSLYKPYIDKVIDDALTLQGGLPADEGESPADDEDEVLNDD